MDFDEYEYLEKTVEEDENRSGSSSRKKTDKAEQSERSYRKKEGDEIDGEEGEERKNKRARCEERDRDRHRSTRDEERERKDERRDRELEREKKAGRRERDGEKDRERERDRDRSRDLERDKERERRSREKEKEKERERERDKDKEKEREREKRERGRERERESEREKERDKERREREKEKERERERERERREKERDREERERSRRSRSRSRKHDSDYEREREYELSRRFKEKKEVAEPEADPERDQRTVFAYQMPLKATERDVYDFFSQAGKVRDVRLIMDRNSRRSKGVGYIEFYDAMSVPMAITLSGHLLLGQPVMVKPSEAEKNLVQSTSTGTGSGGFGGPYGPVDRKLYVGNLHFNMTEHQLRQIFEPFGIVELVQLPLDPETGHCKGFGFVQFAQVEHSKAAQSLNGKLEIAGRIIKVSCVTDHVGVQDTGAKSADFDDDEGGGLALNAQSRALLMQKLDRTGVATSIAGSLGAPVLNGPAPTQLGVGLPANGQLAVPAPHLPPQVVTSPVGNPSECLLLKNMFDPATETDPDFDLDIKEDVEEECSKYGRVKHIYVDKNSAGHVYLRFDSVEAASKAQRAMHMRWFARRLVSAMFMLTHDYETKFRSGA